MKKAIVIICLTAVIFGIVLTLEWMGLLYVHGETTLTYVTGGKIRHFGRCDFGYWPSVRRDHGSDYGGW